MDVQKRVPGKTYGDSAVSVGRLKSPSSAKAWEAVVLPKITIPHEQDQKGKACVPVWWFVQTTPHVEVANVHVVSKDVQVASVKLSVPIMVAKQYISVGDELLVHRPKKSHV